MIFRVLRFLGSFIAILPSQTALSVHVFGRARPLAAPRGSETPAGGRGQSLHRPDPAGADLGLRIAGELIQIMRRTIDQVLEEPFTLSARARGISDLRYSLSHGLKHASIPAVTVSGWIVGSLLAGTFLIEVLFGRSDLGSLTVQAVLSRDTPLVMGVALNGAVIYVVTSILVDIIVRRLDPRLRA